MPGPDGRATLWWPLGQRDRADRALASARRRQAAGGQGGDVQLALYRLGAR